MAIADMLRSVVTRALDKWKIRRDPISWARAQGVSIGERCRLLGVNHATFGSEPYLITIGDHVTLTSNVRFVTHDGGVWVLRDEEPRLDVFGRITIGSNVFIGLSSIILPGVTIGDNVVVGAGAVVNRDIPSDSVAVGVPARVVSSLADYRERSLARAIMTKGLSPHEKRRAIEEALPKG